MPLQGIVRKTIWSSCLAIALSGSFASGAAGQTQQPAMYGLDINMPAPARPTSAFQGSLTTGNPTAGAVPLSLQKAIEMGLANNLGLLVRKEGSRAARGQQWLELSRLLPGLSTGASVHRLRESLAITGITLPGAPSVVGPFTFYDVRAFLNQRLFDLEAINRNRASGHQVAAADLSEKDARELVVVAVGAAYLQALASQARVDTTATQVATARTLLDRAVQLHQAGVTPGIDELRARVEFLNRSQLLIVAQNNFDKHKLDLIRMIGLPVGQAIVLVDQKQEAVPPPALEVILPRALNARKDYQAAEQLVKAAEASLQAARAEHIPTLMLTADFGYTGLTPSSMRDTYHIVGSINWPIFEGGRIHGETLRSEALLRQRRDELADLAAQIEYELRTALLDLYAMTRQVEVARETVQLAETTLSQAQERFSAGISDNVDVVLAQQSLAAAHEGRISSQYNLDLARLLLERAMGTAEEGASRKGL